MIVEWLGRGRKELDYKYILKVEPIVFAHGLDVSFEREELRPELLVKKNVLSFTKMGKTRKKSVWGYGEEVPSIHICTCYSLYGYWGSE